MKCSQIMQDGSMCGSELMSRGAYRNDPSREKCTCGRGHKRSLRNVDGVVLQGRVGAIAGMGDKGKNISIRPRKGFLEKLSAAGYTAQQWWDYSQSIDIPQVGGNIVLQNPVIN